MALATKDRRRLVLLAGVASVVAVVVFLLAHRSAAASSTTDTSGTPGPFSSSTGLPVSGGGGGGAQVPNGGQADVVGNLPSDFFFEPDWTTDVQTTDTTDLTAPLMVQTRTGGGGSGEPVPFTVNGAPVVASGVSASGRTTYTAPGITDRPTPSPPAQSGAESSPYSFGVGGKQ